MMPKATTLVFLGRSGCGKDTQIGFLLARPDFQGAVKTDTGTRFRGYSKNNTVLGRKTKETLDRGARCPDWFAFAIWLFAAGEKLLGEEILISSGSPRSLREAGLIDEALEFLERPKALAVLLEISPTEAKKRLLLRGRHDDSEKAIENRLAYYERDVLPAAEYYRKQECLMEVNGEQTREEVFKELENKLESYFA